MLGVIMVREAKAQLPLDTVEAFKLPSGLEVIVQENNSASVVAMQFWVKTGSTHETRSEAGISHLIEHMVFKGTKHYKPGEIARLIEANGGSINAYTSFDYTVYHVVMPSAQWETGLRILADMVQNALFDHQELASEKKVVLEEIRKNQDSPFSVLFDALLATAYQQHPYRYPIIGYTETVKDINRARILKYYQKWYQPSNMVAVIVGNIKKEQVKKALNSVFSGPFVSPPSIKFPSEPPQKDLHLLTMKKPFKETYLGLAYPIPGMGESDAYALDVLSEILGMGDSSRLNIALKLKRPIVHSIATYAFTPKGPGLFILQAVLEANNLKTALREIFAQIEEIKQNGVSSEELVKAKLNLESEFVYKQETMEGWANTLGFFQVVEEDAKKCADYLTNIRAVTKAKVKEVAQKYLIPQHLSLVAIIPETAPIKLTKEEIYALWPQKKQQVKNKKGIQKFVLDNGLTLVVKENHRLPTFSLAAAFMGGLRAETTETNGICNFMTKMLMRGTKKHSAVELATLIEDMAGEVDTFSGWNTFGLTAHFLSRFFDDAISLIAETLLEPAFDAEETERLRPLILAAIRQKQDKPSSLAFSQFYQRLFPHHPYGMDVLGRVETISRIKNTDLAQFYQKYAVPNNLVLVVVGDIEIKEVVKKIKKLFGNWSKKKVIFPQSSLPSLPSSFITVKKHLPKEQVHFVLGSLGTTLYNEDKYPMAVLDAILSGQGGRLFINLRDKKGLAYALTFVHREGIEPGVWAVYMATSPDKLDEAIKGVKEEIRRLREKGIEEEEIERAKQYILGNFVIGLQTNTQQALSMALNERYGLGYNYDEIYQQKIKKVKKSDIIKVIRSYLHEENCVLSLVGPVK